METIRTIEITHEIQIQADKDIPTLTASTELKVVGSDNVKIVKVEAVCIKKV